MSFSLSTLICSPVTVFWTLFFYSFSFCIVSGVGKRFVSDDGDDGNDDDSDDDNNDDDRDDDDVNGDEEDDDEGLLFVTVTCHYIWLTNLIMS